METADLESIASTLAKVCTSNAADLYTFLNRAIELISQDWRTRENDLRVEEAAGLVENASATARYLANHPFRFNLGRKTPVLSAYLMDLCANSPNMVFTAAMHRGPAHPARLFEEQWLAPVCLDYFRYSPDTAKFSGLLRNGLLARVTAPSEISLAVPRRAVRSPAQFVPAILYGIVSSVSLGEREAASLLLALPDSLLKFPMPVWRGRADREFFFAAGDMISNLFPPAFYTTLFGLAIHHKKHLLARILSARRPDSCSIDLSPSQTPSSAPHTLGTDDSDSPALCRSAMEFVIEAGNLDAIRFAMTTFHPHTEGNPDLLRRAISSIDSGLLDVALQCCGKGALERATDPVVGDSVLHYAVRTVRQASLSHPDKYNSSAAPDPFAFFSNLCSAAKGLLCARDKNAEGVSAIDILYEFDFRGIDRFAAILTTLVPIASPSGSLLPSPRP